MAIQLLKLLVTLYENLCDFSKASFAPTYPWQPCVLLVPHDDLVRAVERTERLVEEVLLDAGLGICTRRRRPPNQYWYH